MITKELRGWYNGCLVAVIDEGLSTYTIHYVHGKKAPFKVNKSLVALQEESNKENTIYI